jgi:hypothetical protein
MLNFTPPSYQPDKINNSRQKRRRTALSEALTAFNFVWGLLPITVTSEWTVCVLKLVANTIVWSDIYLPGT